MLVTTSSDVGKNGVCLSTLSTRVAEKAKPKPLKMSVMDGRSFWLCIVSHFRDLEIVQAEPSFFVMHS